MRSSCLRQPASCFGEFLKYAAFNVLGMIGLSCYILADTYFVSKGLGTDGLAALNLAIPVYSLIHGCGLMIGMGGGARYSIIKSIGEHGETDRLFTNAVSLAAILAALFVLCGVFFSGPAAAAAGAVGTVYSMTRLYLQVILLFSPAFLMNNTLLCFVRNDGAPKLAMAAMMGGSMSNILLDYLFIFPCGMGMFGAAFATGLAPIISMAILSSHFIRRQNRFHMIKCRLTRQRVSGILISGTPSLVTEVSSGLVILTFNSILLRLQGNTGVAAYGIIANLSLVVLSVYTGIAQGIQPIAAASFGAGDECRAREIMRYALISMGFLSAALYAGIFAFAEPICNVFNSAGDETLTETAVQGLKLYFTSCPFAGFNIISSMYFICTARALPANLISILRGIAIVIPTAFLLSFTAGVTGVWCAVPCTELIVAGIGAVMLIKAPAM